MSPMAAGNLATVSHNLRFMTRSPESPQNYNEVIIMGGGPSARSACNVIGLLLKLIDVGGYCAAPEPAHQCVDRGEDLEPKPA